MSMGVDQKVPFEHGKFLHCLGSREKDVILQPYGKSWACSFRGPGILIWGHQPFGGPDFEARVFFFSNEKFRGRYVAGSVTASRFYQSSEPCSPDEHGTQATVRGISFWELEVLVGSVPNKSWWMDRNALVDRP